MGSNRTIVRLTEIVLIRGLDDWVYLGEVRWLSKKVSRAWSEEKLITQTLTAVRHLLEQGLCQIGDVTDGGFFEWDLPIDEALERVRKERRQLGPDIGPGDVCWLANTPQGDRRAEELLTRKQAE